MATTPAAPTSAASGLRAAVLHRDRGPRATGRDGEPLEQTGREARGADADHLPVPVDLRPSARREHARGRDGVGQ
jgi:hypothetical protein